MGGHDQQSTRHGGSHGEATVRGGPKTRTLAVARSRWSIRHGHLVRDRRWPGDFPHVATAVENHRRSYGTLPPLHSERVSFHDFYGRLRDA